METRLARALIRITLIALALLALPTAMASAAYPGKPGPIAYNKYKDVALYNSQNGLFEVHPEGGLFTHGPRVGQRPRQLTSEASDSGPAFSPNGRLIAFASTRGQTGLSRTPQLYLMRADGSGLRQLTSDPRGAAGPYFSPDGRRLVFARRGHLWLLRIRNGAQRQLTFGSSKEGEAVFTPDGRRILFSSNRKRSGGHDSSDIWAVGADGRNARVLVNGAGAELSPEVSPDGRRIAYVVEQSNYFGYGNLIIARADGRFLRSLDQKPGPECRPCLGASSWAPDGRHLAAVEITNDVGSTTLEVMRPDGSHRRGFDDGTTEAEGFGVHVQGPAWGSAPGR